MTVTEAVIVVVVIIAATVAAVLNHLTPELGLLLGVALGYGGARVAPTLASGSKEAPWKGSDE